VVAANARTEDLLARFEWYDDRMRRIMQAYALSADDVVKLNEIFEPMSYREDHTIDVVVLYDAWVGPGPRTGGMIVVVGMVRT
jgi:hypothetical protein